MKQSAAESRATATMAPMDLLPIHFFTIVLNGKPFITYHLEAFRHLPFEW
jgi:hypothetical protein